MVLDDQTRDRWDGQLARLALSRRSDLSAFTAELFGHEFGRAYVEQRVQDDEFGDAAWRVAQFEVEELCRQRTGEWVSRALFWLDAVSADWERSARFCADVAWTGRSVQNSVLLYMGSADVPRDRVGSVTDRGRLHLILQSLRYDFRFQDILEAVRQAGLAPAELDPFSRAIYVFALLGSKSPTAVSEMDELRRVERSNEKAAHALLHGLWFADNLPDQGERILRLVEETPSLRLDDPTVALRRAYALRRLRRHDDALASIDLGLRNLSPAAVDVHQDFARERAMILVVREIEGSFSRERLLLHEEAARYREEIVGLTDTRIIKIEDKISDSLFKVVEILALFTAVIALLAAGAASVTIGQLEWWQRALVILSAGFVVMMLFVAIRIIVRPPRRVPPTPGGSQG